MKKKRLTLLIAFVLVSIISNGQWLLTGNAGTSPSTNFIGTRDARDLHIRTNNLTRMIIGSNGTIRLMDPVATANNNFPYTLIMEKYSPGIGLQIGMMSTTNASAGIYVATRGPGRAIAGNASLAGSISVSGDNSDGVGVQGKSYNTWGVVARSTNYYGLVAIGNSYAAYFVGSVFSSGGYYAASDQKLKKDVQEISSAMNLINQLHPKKYNYRQDGNYGSIKLPQGTQYGLIAQDVEKVLPDLVKDTKFDAPVDQPGAAKNESLQTNKKPESIQYKALNYTGFIPIMIKGMQEQEQKLDEQQQQINNQKKKIEELEQLINEVIKSRPVTNNHSALNNSDLKIASLEQNAPNPFSQNTIIHYTLPQNAGRATIDITDINGKLIRSYPASNTNGRLVIKAGELPSGTYQYSLVMNGKLIETKKMVLLK
jgi:hypothetical protein